MSSNPFGGGGQMFAAAITHHEMVISYINAGFTREEAIAITTDMLKDHGRNAQFIAADEERRKKQEGGQQ